MKLVDDVFYTDANEEPKRLSSLNVFISTNVQETFSDWPDDESNAIILFFIGCEHHCVNCHNSCLSKIPKSEINYWNKEFKLSKNHINHYEFFKEQFKTRKFVKISSIDVFERFIIELCEKYNTNKIIFQGGDPFYKHNQDVVEFILKRFRSKYNDKYKFCVYTGYNIKDCVETLMVFPDYLKCGTFKQELYQEPGKDREKLVFASTNQELYECITNNKNFVSINKLSDNGIYYFNKTLNQLINSKSDYYIPLTLPIRGVVENHSYFVYIQAVMMMRGFIKKESSYIAQMEQSIKRQFQEAAILFRRREFEIKYKDYKVSLPFCFGGDIDIRAVKPLDFGKQIKDVISECLKWKYRAEQLQEVTGGIRLLCPSRFPDKDSSTYQAMYDILGNSDVLDLCPYVDGDDELKNKLIKFARSA